MVQNSDIWVCRDWREGTTDDMAGNKSIAYLTSKTFKHNHKNLTKI